MIGAVIDILLLYWYMMWYYILELPYWLKIYAELNLVCLIALTLTRLIWRLFIKILIPLIAGILLLVIRLVQRGLFLAFKHSKGKEAYVRMDDRLNAWGLGINGFLSSIKSLKAAVWKKGSMRKGWILLNLIAGIVIIAPFYLERDLSDNAAMICGRINHAVERTEERLFENLAAYYEPASKQPGSSEEEAETAQGENVILHLNAEGAGGSFLRSSPERTKSNVLGTVSGNDELTYLGNIQETKGTTWILVGTKEIKEAWISAKLIIDEDKARIDLN